MPCFFLISGLLFRMKNESIRDTLIHRAKTLLIPYLVLSILFVFLNPNNYQGDIFVNFKTNAWDILMGNSGFMTVSLWFVYVLFEVCCATAVLYRLTQHFNTSIRNNIVCVVLLICIIGDAFCHTLTLPFKLSDFFISWFMYLTGYLMQTLLKRLAEIHISRFVIFTIITLTVAIILFEIKRSANGIITETHRMCLMLTGSLSLIGLVYTMTRMIRENFIGAALRYLANNAMCFLAVHMWIICLCLQYMSRYNPFVAATLGLTLSLIMMPITNTYVPWLIGKKRP